MNSICAIEYNTIKYNMKTNIIIVVFTLESFEATYGIKIIMKIVINKIMELKTYRGNEIKLFEKLIGVKFHS